MRGEGRKASFVRHEVCGWSGGCRWPPDSRSECRRDGSLAGWCWRADSMWGVGAVARPDLVMATGSRHPQGWASSVGCAGAQQI
jgi:hypothetical protein